MSTEDQNLILVLEDSMGQRIIPLDNIYYSIGRSPSSHIRLFDTFVSREHALIIRIPDSQGNGYTFMIFDGDSGSKRSTNGLFINGAAVRSHQLQPSDVINFGPKVVAQVDTAENYGVNGLSRSNDKTLPPSEMQSAHSTRTTGFSAASGSGLSNESTKLV